MPVIVEDAVTRQKFSISLQTVGSISELSMSINTHLC